MRQVDFTVARPKIKRPLTKSQKTGRRKAISLVLFLQRADQKGFPWGGSGPSRMNHNDQLHRFNSEFEIPRHTFSTFPGRWVLVRYLYFKPTLPYYFFLIPICLAGISYDLQPRTPKVLVDRPRSMCGGRRKTPRLKLFKSAV